MMILQTAFYPPENQWSTYCKRPALDTRMLDSMIEEIFESIKSRGDAALVEYAERFENRIAKTFRLDDTQLERAGEGLDAALRDAIQLAAKNIRKFHMHQLAPDKEPVETSEGVLCWQKRVPLNRVGLYVPGGTAPLLSTVLMLAIPAAIAGCKEIVLCTPPDSNGVIHEAVLYAARIAGVDEMYAIGGAQAIAAMAVGTNSIKAVDKIFGPGNQYVTAAKQYASRHFCSIDMPAGPSEVLVIADGSADPVFVAADLLAQAEHGVDSQVMLVSTSKELIKSVNIEVSEQLKTLPRADIAVAALAKSHALLLRDLDEAMRFSNQYAPEHLIIATSNADEISSMAVHAGSVFVGHFTPESAGDYASGTNHTLPTNGYARSISGLTTDSFTKTISFQQISESGLQLIGPSIEIMATAENLDAHARAVTLRLNKIHGT